MYCSQKYTGHSSTLFRHCQVNHDKFSELHQAVIHILKFNKQSEIIVLTK